MERSEHSSRKKRAAQVIGTSALILIAAGTIGLPFDVVAAVIVGAAAVLMFVP